MNSNNKLALVVAYYLAKYDQIACARLGYPSRTAAFNEIGNQLKVKHTTIKNMRDDFDSVFPYRRGWHQRPLSPSRIEVIMKYQDLSEEALFSVVDDILNIKRNSAEHTRDFIFESLNGDLPIAEKRQFGTRASTGVIAEEIFKNMYEQGQIDGYDGRLIDKRYDGCGYDFETAEEPKQVFEVKGLSEKSGGIVFTDKEWSKAKELNQLYILVIVSHVKSEEPLISLICDPYGKLLADKQIFTSVTVSWSVDSKQMRKVLSST